MANCRKLLSAVTRKKHFDESTMEESKLARVLNTFDITALGVGSTLGAGVYVLTGAVAKDTSGPSVVLAFLIAALTSILSGLCYAEFGARVPKAGSGYVYSYVTVGELVAFVIGWNLVLAYIIGSASVARAWTANFDALIDKRIHNFMVECCTMNVPGLAAQPDLFSFVIIIVLTALIAFGVKEFATVNKIFTVLNIGVICFVVIAGLTQADLHNWNLTPEEIVNISIANNITNVTLTTYGDGGFFPYGFSGLITGTATCFYAFVGFDCIATTGEEAKNPQKSIPWGIVFSLTICAVVYLLISSTLTLMQPYFMLDVAAPLPYAFEMAGMHWAMYPVSVGAICALSTSLLGSMFPMPRIIYAMAIDGLLFKFLANVNQKTKTPLIATFISGTFAGIMAVFFDLKELVDLMSIGTLTAYTLVATSVLLLRYKPVPGIDCEKELTKEEIHYAVKAEEAEVVILPNRRDSFHVIQLIRPASRSPTHLTALIVSCATAVLALNVILFSVVALLAASGTTIATILFLSIFGICVIICTIVIAVQPTSKKELSFKVPLIPYIPIVNMFVNVYIMVSLPPSTWYKLLVWMILGCLIYFFYGVPHSVEGHPDKKAKLHDEDSPEGRKLVDECDNVSPSHNNVLIEKETGI